MRRRSIIGLRRRVWCEMEQMMGDDVKQYLELKTGEYREICELLQAEIAKALPDAENKVWHAHPVWFLDGNPIVGYSVQKPGARLM